MGAPGLPTGLYEAGREVLPGPNECDGLAAGLCLVKLALFRCLERVLPAGLEINCIGQQHLHCSRVGICNASKSVQVSASNSPTHPHVTVHNLTRHILLSIIDGIAPLVACDTQELIICTVCAGCRKLTGTTLDLASLATEANVRLSCPSLLTNTADTYSMSVCCELIDFRDEVK